MKNTWVQIRVTEKEKELLTLRARELHMNLSEYMVHAGICYAPSPDVQEAVDKFNDLVRKPV